MNSLLVLALACFAQATSEDYGPVDVVGGSVPSNLDSTSTGYLKNAQNNPNSTRTVTFKPFASVEGLDNDSAAQDLEFSWRINISDFSAPNAASSDFNAVTDPHIISASYDFTWSGNSNLSSFFGGTTPSFCFGIFSTPDMPVNVTNAYTSDDDSDCTKALGSDCVKAILAKNTFSGDPDDGHGCISDEWSTIPECASTLGYVLQVVGEADVDEFGAGFNDTRIFSEAGGWYAHISGAQNGSGSDDYYFQANRLHVALLNPVIQTSDDNGDDLIGQGPSLICMRVNSTALPTKYANGTDITLTSEAVVAASSGNSGSGAYDSGSGSGDSNPDNTGSSLQQAAGATAFVATFITLLMSFAL
ncbi:hypothetical protein F5Y16DRAFT_42005 [Xylariaceae sp. FL0255]|nr:hypothetical protein F5Y16DRAFT_42005 [Xylariaceae sp. FL0255]